jgi:hypothetical protein
MRSTQTMRSQKLQQNQETKPHTLAKRSVLAAFHALAILCLFVFTSLLTAPSASAKEIKHLPHEPANPKVLQVYFNTTDNREYIYNGEEWVPHDASIDTYVLKKYKKPKISKNPSNGAGAGNISDSSNNQGVSK